MLMMGAFFIPPSPSFHHLFRSFLTCSAKGDDAFDAVATETVTAPVGADGGASLFVVDEFIFLELCERALIIFLFLFFSFPPLSLF